MIRVFGIVFLNLWHGISRRSTILAMLVLFFAFTSVFMITSRGQAIQRHQTTDKSVASIPRGSNIYTPKQSTTVDSLAFVNPNARNQININQRLAQNTQPKASKDKPKPAGDASTSSSKPSKAAQLVVTAVKVATTTTCNANNQSQIAVTGATITLQNVPKDNTTPVQLQWYWETRIDSGKNTSNQPPIDSSMHTVSASSNTVTLSASDLSLPAELTASDGYTYSFRLHVTSPTDITAPVWISVPASTVSCNN